MEKSILKAARMEVVSMNSCLKEVVETMSPIIMLRNMHPMSRAHHARNFHLIDLINDQELKEFPSHGITY